MARIVPEWIGKSDDHRAPGGVRDRILARIPCCHLCSLPIDGTKKWDLDHVVALINGGENREKNLRPAHTKCHKEKTARDVAEKAKVAAVRKKHNGSVRPAGKLQGQPLPTTDKASKRAPRPSLPPRQLFREVTT